MGRIYRATNVIDEFDVNYSGADILGLIAHKVGHHDKKLEANNLKYGITDCSPSTTFIATRVECLDHATALQALSPYDLLTIYNQCILHKTFAGCDVERCPKCGGQSLSCGCNET